MRTNVPAGRGMGQIRGEATAEFPFCPKLLVVLVLLAAWISLMVVGARYPHHVDATVPEVTGVSGTDQQSTAKSYVVVRPVPADVPVVMQASSVPKPLTQASPPVTVPDAARPTFATYQRPQEKQPAVGLDSPSRLEPHPPISILSQDRRDVGRNMMGADGKREGEVPIITMDYRQQLGWPEYVQAMTRLGGIFLVFDKQTERILAQADFLSNNLLDIRQQSLTGMSPRIREIFSEGAITEMMDKARQEYGPSANTVILLLPLNVDFDIIGGIAQQLAQRNIEAKTAARVLGEYEMSGDGIRLHARKVIRRDGTTSQVDFTIDL